MIVTRNWLQEWIDISQINSEKLVKILNEIGLEVDSYSEIRLPQKVVIGYVKSKRAHENSDKLNICEVDVGSEILQIVCGAKNVETGQYVAVSLIGATLPNGIKIKPAKLRGVDSFGMICSATELGLPKLNDGIMVLDNSIGDIVVGRELCKYPLLNDDIIEIGLTPNRGDCLSIYGVARDLSVALDISLKPLSYSDQDGLLGIGRLLGIHSNEKINSFFEYKAFSIEKELKLDLIKSLRINFAGISKGSVTENLLAYATYSTGVLLRAYDGQKLKNKDDKVMLEIRSEEFGNSSVYENDQLVSLAGISQDDKFKVDENSKLVIIEANYTDPKIIATATNENKELKGDEHIYRAVRGSEPKLSVGLEYLCSIISKNDSINLYSGTQQVKPIKEPKTVIFSAEQINNITGKEILRNDAVKILKKLGFEIGIEQDLINAKVPLFRHDIENVYDIAEEIVRIVGIDNIPSKALIFNEQNRINNYFKEYKNKKNLKRKACDNGFFECIHYIFDSEEELLKFGFKKCKTQILNPITSDLNALRPTLINHLLKSSVRNYKNSQRSIKLFEIGAVFDENAKQSDKVAFLMSGLINEASLLNTQKPRETDFITFASKVQNIIGKFSCKVPNNAISYLNKFEQAQIIQDKKVIGYIGRVDLSIENELELPKTYICEINYEDLKFDDIVAKAYSKFPSISRDLSLIIPKNMRYEEVREVLKSVKTKNLKSFNLVDIYSDDSLKNFNSVTIKFIFQSMEETLEDNEISKELDEILKALKEKLNVGIR